MAANHTSTSPSAGTACECLSPSELAGRLDEEVSRADRHHTALCCLLVCLDDIEQLAETHGAQFPAQALAYIAEALGRQLRRFDRVGQATDTELLVLLPGADERRGEIVARRALGRLHSVKVEADGRRRPLRISMGVAAWRSGLSAEQLLLQTRLAARRQDGHERPQTTLSGERESPVGELPLLGRS